MSVNGAAPDGRSALLMAFITQAVAPVGVMLDTCSRLMPGMQGGPVIAIDDVLPAAMNAKKTRRVAKW